MAADIRFRGLLVPVLMLLALLGIERAAEAQAGSGTASGSSCQSCHSTLADPRVVTPATTFSQADVHRASGFSCVDCHGGDVAAATMDRAHDARKGFRGRPAGQAASRHVRAATATPT
jgi:hypothetical protein